MFLTFCINILGHFTGIKALKILLCTEDFPISDCESYPFLSSTNFLEVLLILSNSLDSQSKKWTECHLSNCKKLWTIIIGLRKVIYPILWPNICLTVSREMILLTANSKVHNNTRFLPRGFSGSQSMLFAVWAAMKNASNCKNLFSAASIHSASRDCDANFYNQKRNLDSDTEARVSGGKHQVIYYS